MLKKVKIEFLSNYLLGTVLCSKGDLLKIEEKKAKELIKNKFAKKV